MTGSASSMPSICFKRSTYLVSRLAVVAVSCTAPGRMKINSARTFVARRCNSLDMPRARPVNSMTRATPSATPATLTSVRIGRWRMFEVTRLSICNKLLTGFNLEYNLAAAKTYEDAQITIHLLPINLSHLAGPGSDGPELCAGTCANHDPGYHRSARQHQPDRLLHKQARQPRHRESRDDDQAHSQRTAKRRAHRFGRHDPGLATRVVSWSQEQHATRPDDACDELAELRLDDGR